MLVAALGSPSASGPLVKYRAGAEVPTGAIVLLPEGVSPAQAATASLILAAGDHASARAVGRARRRDAVDRRHVR